MIDSGAEAKYSGLLECPVTTRLRKDIDAGYEALAMGHCTHVIRTAAECFSAVSRAIPRGTAVQGNTTVQSYHTNTMPL